MVELLVWTYQRQKADIMSGRGLWGPEATVMEEEPFHQWSGDGCAKLEATAAYGCDIDGGGWQRPVLHPDAEIVHDAVVELSHTDWIGAMLLRRYGRQGGTPEWSGENQRWIPAFLDAREMIAECVLVTYKNRFRKMVEVKYTPVCLYPSDAWMAMMRAEYRRWWDALGRVRGLLDGGRLGQWMVDGIGAKRDPWEIC